MRRVVLSVSFAVLALLASAAPAPGAVTIGQLAPGTPDLCDGPVDTVQPTVTSGNSYVVPAVGTVTSWSHVANSDPSQELALKIFRLVAGSTYQVVGRDGPHPVTPNVINTFPTSVPVRPGDVLGLYVPDSSPRCADMVPGEHSFLFRTGNLSDSASGAFTANPNFRLNAAAVVNPSNSFTLGSVNRNKKKGTATLTVSVPNPGEIALAGNGVKGATALGADVARTVPAAGEVELLIKAKGKKKRKLRRKGKVKVSPTVTFIPTGGDPSAQTTNLKLRKKR